jgi:hypothetical protein
MNRFSTDQLISTIDPPHRVSSRKEESIAVKAIRERRFDVSTYLVFNWSDIDNLPKRSIKVCAPNPNYFQIKEEGNQFWIFRSKKLLNELAARFGKAKVQVATTD